MRVLIICNCRNNNSYTMIILFFSSQFHVQCQFWRATEAELTIYFWTSLYLSIFVVTYLYSSEAILFYVCKFLSHVLCMHFKEISVQSVIHNNNVFQLGFFELAENKFLQCNEDPWHFSNFQNQMEIIWCLTCFWSP